VSYFELVTLQKGCSPVGGRIKYGGFAGAKLRFGQFQGGLIVLMKHAQRFSLAIAALSVAALLAGSATPAAADNGDCSQPVSNGPNPVATDCLYILRTAVGLLTCDPTCICDLNASGGNPNATDSLGCLNAAVGVPDLLNCDCGGGTTTTTVGGSTTTTVDGGTTTTTDGGSTTTTTIGGGGACPDTLELVVYGGAGVECTTNADCDVGTCDDAGTGRCRTVTELDTGFTGISHDADINNLQQTVVSLDCAASEAPCGVCEVAGVDPVNRACRCENDNQAICDQPFVADADDCGGSVCNCYLGPPLPLSAGLTPACVVNRLANDVSGTVNVDTGTGSSTVNLRSSVFLGIFVPTPCPFCDGDTIVGDGVRDGACSLGLNDGDPCDADAENTTFPWVSSTELGGGTSLDCFPDPGVNVSGAGLKIDLPLSTGAQQLTSAVTCGFPPVIIEQCPCGVCNGDATVTCTNNTDCVDAGAGATCANPGGGAVRQNKCAGDGVCNDVGGGEGQCNQGAVNYCDDSLRANGVPFISCNSNDDCNAYPGTGVCTTSVPQECFLATIDAAGTPEPDFPVGVSTFCIAQTSNGGINSVAGLPGPGRVVNQGRTVKYCGGFGGDVYEANTGCP
jgi:hypothetical protein